MLTIRYATHTRRPRTDPVADLLANSISRLTHTSSLMLCSYSPHQVPVNVVNVSRHAHIHIHMHSFAFVTSRCVSRLCSQSNPSTPFCLLSSFLPPATILKQMKILHLDGFKSPEEKASYKALIWKNTLESVHTLCNACEALKIAYDSQTNKVRERKGTITRTRYTHIRDFVLTLCVLTPASSSSFLLSSSTPDSCRDPFEVECE